jgi:hypothetical protein
MPEWIQPMLNPRDCIHGSLARKCEICDRDEEIHTLRKALREIADADPVDMALDPGWAARIAKAASDEAQP